MLHAAFSRRKSSCIGCPPTFSRHCKNCEGRQTLRFWVRAVVLLHLCVQCILDVSQSLFRQMLEERIAARRQSNRWALVPCVPGLKSLHADAKTALSIAVRTQLAGIRPAAPTLWIHFVGRWLSHIFLGCHRCKSPILFLLSFLN